MSKLIKGILIILLLLCLADMPYGYYIFVRWAATLGFGYFAYQAHKQEQNYWMLICIAIAILFQPFAKIPLGRFLWNVVDVLLAISLIISLFIKNNNKK